MEVEEEMVSWCAERWLRGVKVERRGNEGSARGERGKANYNQ